MENSSVIWQKKLPTGTYQVCAQKPDNAVTVKQIHGSKVVSIQEILANTLEADGIYWQWEDLEKTKSLPTILTADCLPLILLGEEGGAILHAGWRGVKTQIYLNSVLAPLKLNYFFIGPSIQPVSFEVTSEFLEYFENKDLFSYKNNKCTFNLQQQVILDLKKYYPGIQGEDCAIDTFADTRFQSFRRDKKNRTNNYNIFTLSS